MITGNKYVIKLTSSNTSQLFGFSPAFTISGVIPDAFEPDDSAGVAHAIATTGVPESHTLSLNDKDVNFSAAANYLYVIKTIGAVSSLTLYGTDGKTSITTSSSTNGLFYNNIHVLHHAGHVLFPGDKHNNRGLSGDGDCQRFDKVRSHIFIADID